MTTTPPERSNTNAGRAARRSSSPGPAADDPRALPAAPAAAVRRRRFRPSPLRTFLAFSGLLALVFDAAGILRRARRGPWRAEVAEESMVPALLPGDWILLDPTGRRWPRPGSIVVVREPGTGILAIKRVVARGSRPARGRAGRAGTRAGTAGAGSRTRDAVLVTLPDGTARELGSREAWVVGDAAGGSIDSRTYGPLDADALVARAWFRYGPPRRIGRLG